MKEKLNIVFKPFILALIVLIGGYTLIHWALFISLNLFSVKQTITNFAFPIALSALIAWFFLRHRLKVLKLKTKKGSWSDFYCFIAWVALTIPLVIAQEYIITATGRLTELNSIKDINNVPPTKYYSLKRHYIDKQVIGIYSAFDVSGKHNEDFNMRIYVAMPIFESADDTLSSVPLGWLGVKYYRSISNRLTQNEKEVEYAEFANESQKDFNGKDVSRFVYLDRIGNTDDRDGYLEAIKSNSVYSPNDVILVGVAEPFEARNGRKLEWIGFSALIGSLVWLIMVLLPEIDDKQLRRIKAGKRDETVNSDLAEFIDFLKPKEGYFVTPILMYINIGIFVLMMIMGFGFISFNGQDLLGLGANFRPLTVQGQWWRLLTSMFLHGGLMHVFANMYGLMFVGIFLEPLLGRIKYLTVYLLTGILAGLTSIWWYNATVSVGASGAIFGLYGIFLALILTKHYPPDFSKSFLVSTLIFVGYSLLMGIAGGVDNAAHIGGILSGLAVGFILSPGLKQPLKDDV